MSWNKNTHVCSKIDTTIELLKEQKIPYSLTELGKVMGMGLNDDYPEPFGGKEWYPIRRLEYQNFVLLEQMNRDPDCDGDDHLISMKFKKSKEPKNWPLEIMLEEV